MDDEGKSQIQILPILHENKIRLSGYLIFARARILMNTT
jgi:hypothetical protein